MNKNSISAIVIIMALFAGFFYINYRENNRYQAELAAYEERMAVLEAEKAELRALEAVAASGMEASDSTAVAMRRAKSVMSIGETLTEAKIAKGEVITLENDVMTINFDTKGAQPKGVTLKNYTRYADDSDQRTELIEMFAPQSAKMEMSFFINSGFNNVKINTSEYAFEALPVQKMDNAVRQSFMLDFGGGASLEYIYTLYTTADVSRDYMLDFEVKFHDLTPIMANQSSVAIDWVNTTYQNERGFSNENTYTTLSYHIEGESSIKELGVSTESKSDKIADRKINWIAFKQQFFSSVFIAPTNFSSADISFTTAGEGSGYIKEFSSQMTLPYSATTQGYSFALYYGPNEYYILKGTEDLGYGELHMTELIPLGWGIFGWVNKWFVIPIFDLLREWISSFGLIILILAVLIKLVISPLTYSSYISMAKMRVMKPEVDAITAKYPNQEDAMKRQQATMELYKKVGVNPMGGCIPMLIQMPIIIAMFRFFPASIELRGESFLWAHDLSSYDSVLQLPFTIPFYGDHVSLFALLMAVVMFFYSKINYEQQSAQPQMAGMKFMMLYMMPVMMLLWFNSYSSGLCYYYFLANLLTIAQTVIIRRMVDDEKIHATLKANAKRKGNPKKSKFQEKYEAMMAEAEAQKKSKK